LILVGATNLVTYCFQIIITFYVIERHPLFQDNSRLAQLIAQVTGINEESFKRVTAAQSLLDYIYDVSHLEVPFKSLILLMADFE